MSDTQHGAASGDPRRGSGPGAAFGRFLMVGPVGTGLGALQFELLWRLNPLEAQRAWTTWIVSSALGIAWIHAVHCRFTFGRGLRESYLATLPRAYLLQGASALVGALAMQALDRNTALHYLIAWLLVTAGTSLMNFAGLWRMLRTST